MFQEGDEEENKNGGWRVLKDNQLWEKEDANKKVNQPTTLETEVTADGTMEKGLGPADALVQAERPHMFQLLMMKILKNKEDKADWQDQDTNIKIAKEWLERLTIRSR